MRKEMTGFHKEKKKLTEYSQQKGIKGDTGLGKNEEGRAKLSCRTNLMAGEEENMSRELNRVYQR